MKNLEKTFVQTHNTIDEALAVIQQGNVGIAIVVDKQRRLIGTITDGDIRRAILKRIPLTEKIDVLLKQRSKDYAEPVAMPFDTPQERLVEIMVEKRLRQIPLLDKERRVVDLALISEFLEEEYFRPLSAVVMAGGKGRRLYPLTKDTPKPMLPLEDRPLMERTIHQLRKAGIKKIHISTHHKPNIITHHFGNGDAFGVNISYINEDQPLGTAGALGLMKSLDTPVLVVNGDVLTTLDFRAMLDFHHLHKAVMTVGVRKYDLEVPFGIIENEDIVVKDIIEKPVQAFMVNAGIYLLEPTAASYIPKGDNFDMPDLVHKLIDVGHKVISFPIQEYWLDVGLPESYEQAKEDFKSGKFD